MWMRCFYDRIKRLKTAVICFLLVFFFLLARLAEIQLFFTESFQNPILI